MTTDFAGIVLGAGYGTRLRPFTEELPKPLVPVLNHTPLWHQIMLLRESGIEDIYVNLHFMPDLMKKYIKKNFPDVNLIYEPVILGTGGGIRNIISKFNINKPLVVLNGDTISVVNIKEIISFFNETSSDATMLLIKDNSIPYENAVFADRQNHIRYIKKKPLFEKGLNRLRFLGVHILNVTVFEYLPSKGCINKLTYPKLIRDGLNVSACITENDSFDIGKPETLWNTNIKFLQKKITSPVFKSEYISRIVDKNGNVIGQNTSIFNSLIKNSVIADDVVIRDSKIDCCLIFPNTKLSNQNIKRCVANNKYKYIIKSR
ncbi:MAG: NDP-sugar synthase [Deltaproteobacteria bacterium]|nr:NDP-sugar synthase [Deltaproteobacteria bacterium]